MAGYGAVQGLGYAMASGREGDYGQAALQGGFAAFQGFSAYMGVRGLRASRLGTKRIAGAVDDHATTPLRRHLSDLPDDAIVHFGPESFSTIHPGAGGEVFAFRFGDIKHLTPRQIETLAGPLSRAGQKGGSRVMHILDEPLENAVRRSVPGTDISEIVFGKAIKVTEGYIVQ
jgi:hypothetical protein